MTYHYLSLDERYQIQQQLNQGHGVQAITQTLNRHQSTISREIRRGIRRTQTQTYCASQTHHTQQQRHRGHGKPSLDHPNWPTIRESMTYDQGKEMACHEELSERIKKDVYFCDPHSPWQRGSNENANGLIREYLPKGIDLSTFDQDYLDEIARVLNGRPRKVLGFLTPEEVFSQEVIQLKVAVALQS